MGGSKTPKKARATFSKCFQIHRMGLTDKRVDGAERAETAAPTLLLREHELGSDPLIW